MSSASPATRLRSLAATALIGAQRTGAEPMPPEKLLTQAAAAGARARAGYRPRHVPARPQERPSDNTPLARPAATATLMRLLGDPDAGLIEEWCELAHARGERIPEHAVPWVLDWWCRQPQRSDIVFRVCGLCAEWLAELNPEWRKPVPGAEIPANADDVWQTGKTPERLAVLLTIRRIDPPRALALVQSTWTSDGAEERRRFTEALAQSCTMADETFLESALDDKSKVVRRAAAGVLASLPDSRFHARMLARARAIIQVETKTKLFKKTVLVSLTPPAEFDKAWERDAIEEQAAGGLGPRAWWMQQILSAADLSVWTDTTGLEPDKILEAIAEDDYFANALEAMIRSLGARPSGPWAAAIMRHKLQGKKFEPPELIRLIGPLSPEDRQPLLLEAAESKRFSAADRWTVLALADDRWPPEFSSRALRVLAKSIPHKDHAWGLFAPVERISRVVAPAQAEEFADIVTAVADGEPKDSMKKSTDRARLRADMHKEFAS